MGRARKPTNLLLLEGRKHLTKDEIKDRIAGEIRFGSHKFTIPPLIKKDKVAKAKWHQVIKLITKPEPIEFITTADTGLIERYCLTYSAYIALVKANNSVLDPEINKKNQLLLQMEKELLLTPAAKLRSVGKNKKDKKQTPLEAAGFGNI